MPTTQNIYGPLKNAAFDVYFPLKKPSPAGVGDEDDFLANPTLAAGDIQISKDGGAFGNVATLGVVTPAGGRVVKQQLTAAEMNADVIVLQVVDQTATEAWQAYMVTIYTTDLSRTATPANRLTVDANGRVDVGSNLGQAVTLSAGNLLHVNVKEISEDSAAADNLESYCDGSAKQPVDTVQISGDTVAADNLELYCDGGDNMPVHLVELSAGMDFSSTMKTSLETAVANKLDAAIPGGPTANSINERITAIDNIIQSGGSGDLTAMKAKIDTTGVKVDLSQSLSESPSALTLGYAFYCSLASVVYKRARSGTAYTIYKSDGSTPFVTLTFDSGTNPTSLTP